jgi:hypothetical protein
MGIVVEADCKQLLIYAIAAWKSLEWMAPAPIKTITTKVMQPRAVHPGGPIRSYTRTLSELLAEGEPIMGVINKINKGETEIVASEKGCKFCKHKANCEVLAEKALLGVMSHFEPTGPLNTSSPEVITRLSPEQKSSIMKARGLFKIFLAAIEDDVENTLMSGGAIPGFKLVAGRSNRCFDKGLTSDQVIDILTKELKLKMSEIAPPKLSGPAPIEKLIDVTKRNGKKKLDRLNEIIVKPEGKPTVVPESDKRSPIPCHFEEVINPLG